MSDITTILDSIIIACGIYMIYGAVMLKFKGEITANIMLPKGIKPEHIKDKEGFCNEIYLKLLILGIVTTLVGVVILINDVLIQIIAITAVMYAVFAIALITYGYAIKKAHKKYL